MATVNDNVLYHSLEAEEFTRVKATQKGILHSAPHLQLGIVRVARFDIAVEMYAF
jgi:hypothetical protein